MKSTVRSIAENTAAILAGNIISISIGLATNVLIVRYLGARQLGIYSAVFAYLAFFGIITDLGISSIVTREISKDRSRMGPILGSAIIIKAVLAALAVASSWAAVTTLRYPPEVKLYTYIASASFIFSFASIYRTMFQAELSMKYPVAADIVNVVVKFLLAGYLVYAGAALVWFIVAEVASNIPGLVMTLRFSRRIGRPDMRFDPAVCGMIIRESWPLAVSSLFVVVYSRADVVLLAYLKGATSVGYYSAAYKLTDSLVMLPAAFMASVFPLMSRYFAKGSSSLERSYQLACKYLAMTILPVAAAVTVLSPQIIKFLYGARYLPSAGALTLLTWAAAFVFVNAVFHNMNISIGKQKTATVNCLVMACVNISLNWILIPRYGFMGSAAAMVVTQAAGSMLGVSWLRYFGHRLHILNAVVKPAFGSACAALVLSVNPGRYIGMTIPLAILCYAAALVLTGAFTSEDVDLLKRMLGRPARAGAA